MAFKPKYLSEDLLKFPKGALTVTKKEVLRMGDYTLRMVDGILDVPEGKKTGIIGRYYP